MAATPKKKPGVAALRRMARGEGLDMDALANEHGGFYAAMLRNFRSDVAELKKLGVLPKDIDARNVTPSAYISRVRNEFFDVIRETGGSKTKKVTKSAAKNLKSQGYTVRNDRVILRRTETVRQNEVVPKASPEGLSNKYAVKRINLKRDKTTHKLDEDYLQKHVDTFMNGLTEDEYFTVEIFGHFTPVFHGGERQRVLNYISERYGANNPGVVALRRMYIGGRDEAHKFNQEQEDRKIGRTRAGESKRKAVYRASKKKAAENIAEWDAKHGTTTPDAVKPKAKKRKGNK